MQPFVRQGETSLVEATKSSTSGSAGSSAPAADSGGATSSDDGVTVVTEDPTAGLSVDVLQATAPWPTECTD